MSDNNSTDQCLEYSVNYYDYLFDDREQIPRDALDHFSTCQYCKQEMEDLKSELERSESSAEDKLYNIAEVTNLELHFSYINIPVGCSVARQFLALMASSFQMNTTTPITVHINNCPSCAADLKALQRMELPQQNLLKIGKLLADKTTSSHSEVEIGVMIFQAVSDIQCEKSTIDELVEIVCRPASGIRTLFSLKDGVDSSEVIEGESPYDNLMSFTVLDDNQESQPDSISQTDTGSERSETKKSAVNFNLNKYFKPIAAAAVITIAFLLFNGKTVTANLDLVYKALANIKNVSIKTISPEDGNVIQEVWISRDLNIKLFKTGGKTTLWDVANKQLLSSNNANDIETKKLDSDSISQVSRTMQVPWSLLPFNSMSALPSGSDWKILTSVDDPSIEHDMEVYELIWTDQKTNDRKVFMKWRGFIDSNTFLPKRVEMWKKYNVDGRYELNNAMQISYPETEQIKTIVNDIQSRAKLLSNPQ